MPYRFGSKATGSRGSDQVVRSEKERWHLCATDGAAERGPPERMRRRGGAVRMQCRNTAQDWWEMVHSYAWSLVDHQRESLCFFTLLAPHRGRTTIPRLLTMQRANIVQLRQAHPD